MQADFKVKCWLRNAKTTGRVTPQEIRYARQVVVATLNLLNAIKRELDSFGLSIRPEKVFSAASLTKGLLRDMGLASPQDKFGISDKVLGCAAQSYLGGHVECRVRRTDVPCVVYDVTSEYPTAAALLGVWDIIRAKGIRIEDCTLEARELLSNLTVEQLLDRSVWRRLAFFAKIKVDGELLPARARYDGKSTTIGINYLHANYPLWSTGPELAGAVIGGRTPQIIEAFRLVPVGIQDELKGKEIQIGAYTFHPDSEDFFVKIIEERCRLKLIDKNHPHVLLLKIIANSLYGCFAEMNTKTRSKRRSAIIEIFSGDYHLVQRSCNVEVPGEYNFWPTASLMTAGGRLLLALAEKRIAQAGGCHAMMDTDSIVVVASRTGELIPCENGPERMPDGSLAIRALTWEEADQALNRFDSLSPYDPKLVPHLFKKEDESFADDGKTQMELRYFGISSKNYVLFRGTPQNPEIIKPSQHGIGTYFRPDPRPWIRAKNCACTDKYHPMAFEDWKIILRQYASGYDGILGEVANAHPFIDKLAMRRIRVSTPRELASLRKIDPEKAKPFTFAVSPILMENPHAPNQVLIGASLDPEDWQTQDYVDADTGKIFKLAMPGEDDDPRQPYPRTYLSALHQHAILKESKYPGGDGEGLLGRYHVHAQGSMPRLLGKEVERKQATGDNLAEMRIYEPPEYEIQPKQAQVTRKTLYPTIIDELKSKDSISELAKKTGLSRNTIAKAFQGELIQPRSWELLMKVYETSC